MSKNNIYFQIFRVFFLGNNLKVEHIFSTRRKVAVPERLLLEDTLLWYQWFQG
jgi:hypothetical protein